MLTVNKISERAMELYLKGICCSEAIVYAFAEEAGKNAAEYMKLASGLCGGMGSGENCGAVTGGACAIGIYLGRDTLSGVPAKKCSSISKEFVSLFLKELHSIKCDDLLNGLGHGTPEQRVKCSGIVAAAASLAAETINKHLVRD